MINNAYYKELKVKKIDIDTDELIALLNEKDADELGVRPLDRIVIKNDKKEHITLVVDITKKFVQEGYIGLYEDVFEAIKLGDNVLVKRAEKPKSVKYIKEKMQAKVLSFDKIKDIIEDIKYNNLSKIELTAFMSAIYINDLTVDESYAMAKNIAESGDFLDLGVDLIVDKHSIGGINGRATMIVVPIVASAGLYIPKTSSRAITSASGTADSMEVLADVCLPMDKFKDVVLEHKGAMVWGGGFNLAPVDDKIIKVEYPLSLDPPGQVVASVLAKKYVVKANKVIIDLPVGEELKVKNISEAENLAKRFITVGRKLGIDIKALITNGEQPSGPAFGPALEAKHALRILEGRVYDNLAEKSVELAGKLIEMSGKAEKGKGIVLAKQILKSGKALKKMKDIINAQGKKVDNSKKIKVGDYFIDVHASTDGIINKISVKTLTTIARRAGAPHDKESGVLLHVEQNDSITKGEILFTIYSNNKEKLKSAYEFAKKQNPIILENVVLKEY